MPGHASSFTISTVAGSPAMYRCVRSARSLEISMMKILSLIAAAALAISIMATPSVRAADADKFEDLGVQITSMTLQGTTFAKDPSGRELVCTVIRGEPAKLLVFDVKSGELLHRLALTDAHGAW